jgi:ATP-dependent helicase/DNAse subunit B
MESLVAHGDGQAPAALAAADAAARWARLGEAGAVFRARYGRHVSPFNGDLTGRPAGLDGHFGPAFRWSPTKLETYRRCPHSFLIGSALPLERREEPKEGADVAQYGTLVHEILRALYEELEPDRRNDLEALLATLPAVAGRLLDSAPRRHGFRETAYWLQTRQETEQIIERTVRALAELPGDFTPTYFEQGFGRGQTALVVDLGDSQFQLAGFIDRIDRDRAGRLRIIDYKTSGPYAYDARSLEEGKRLQLPLYAAAARDALRLGEPVEGFYWHVRQAEASGLKLGEYGPRRAIEAALAHSAEAVRAARAGRFAPEPPADGCPSYCAAAEFCWQYRPGNWG